MVNVVIPDKRPDLNIAGDSKTIANIREFRDHMQKLRAKGHSIPDCAFERINKEIADVLG